MANLTISISNSLRVFGASPPTKWGTGSPYTMTWGVSKWGEGTEDLQTAYGKLIGNVLTPSDDWLLEQSIVFANSIGFASETTQEGLTDGGGWNYIFVKPTTEAESRSASTYSAGSTTAQSYTCAAAGNITWS